MDAANVKELGDNLSKVSEKFQRSAETMAVDCWDFVRMLTRTQVPRAESTLRNDCCYQALRSQGRDHFLELVPRDMQ
jgi:hypothetical protein